MSNCPYCGAEVGMSDGFCSLCGGDLRSQVGPVDASVQDLEYAIAPGGEPEEWKTTAVQGVPDGQVTPGTGQGAAYWQVTPGSEQRVPYGVPTPPLSSQGSRSAPPTQPAERRSRPWGIIVLVGVAAFLAAFAVGMAMSHGCSSPNPIASSDSPADSAAGGAAAVEVRDSLEDYSWEDLSKISSEISASPDDSAALEVAKRYKLVDDNGNFGEKQSKKVEFEDGSVASVQIVDFNHDEKSNGSDKAGLTFLFCECVDIRPMNDVNDNFGGWKDSKLRSWMASSLLGKLPEELKSRIVEVDKLTNNVGSTTDRDSVTVTHDKLWLPSVREICGNTHFIGDKGVDNDALNAVINGEGTQYKRFADWDANFEKKQSGLKRNMNGKATKWWYRTPTPGADHYEFFRAVSASGEAYDVAKAANKWGVVPGFCL